MTEGYDPEYEIKWLRAEVARLREQVDRMSVSTMPLGPRKDTQEDIDRRTKQIGDAIVEATKAGEPVLCTTNGKPVAEVRAGQTNPTGQHEGYIVLCPDERAKGFVRPYRDRYKHVGPNVCGKSVPQGLGVSPLFCLMDPGHSGECGSVFGPMRAACNGVTTMGRALSETYARDPKFYGATFCCTCNRHLPVSEFAWMADGERVGS